jgi:2-polyprenyl-6-methoxyphenol hydroxylase-like FAD-dependent oxidoreductase
LRTVIIGAGPTGLFTAIALARRGRDVVVVDRDAGPGSDDPHSWDRKGVMQFHHAHTFRGKVVEALQVEMPDVLRRLTAQGAVVTSSPKALCCRRMLFEKVLRQTASVEPGITLVTGHVDRIVSERGRAVGIEVGRRKLPAELVIDAAGRASRVTASVRPPGVGYPCGAAYVSRQYQLRDDAEAGPMNSPIGLSLSYSGYAAIVFVHDNRTFSVVLVYDGADRRLRELRHESVFEGVVNAIPSLRDWIEPTRSHAITRVLPGGMLYNSYRGQLDESGRPTLPGTISVGDSVCTTTPLAGRGVALALMQSRALLWLLDKHGRHYDACAIAFDRWCADKIKPWFDDHVYADGERLRRWEGCDVDLTRPLPSDLIVAAADRDPALGPLVARYMTMDALPSSLMSVESRAREIYRTGWRPPVPPGPTLDELTDLCVEHGTIPTQLRSTA